MNRSVFIWTSLLILFVATLNIFFETSKLRDWVNTVDTHLKTINVPLYDSLKILRSENKDLYLSSDSLWNYVEDFDSSRSQKIRVEITKQQYESAIPFFIALFLFNLIVCLITLKKSGFTVFRKLLTINPFLFCKISVIITIACLIHFIWHLHTSELFIINLSIGGIFFCLKSYFAWKTYKTTDSISKKQNAELVLIFDGIILGIWLLLLIIGPFFEIAHA